MLSENLHSTYNSGIETTIKHAQRYPSSGTFAYEDYHAYVLV